MVANLKPYFDAVQTAEARVNEIAADIDKLFQEEKYDEATAKRADLEAAKTKAKETNQLYLSMREVEDQANGNDPISRIMRAQDKDFMIGMSAKELEQYSLLRAINAASEANTNPHAWDKAGLELEASNAMAEKLGRKPQGFFVPMDVQMAPIRGQRRAINTQQAGDPTYGGYLVRTELLTESFIDVLRNRLVLGLAGATTLTGLVGDIDIPKKTVTSTGYWIGEGNAPSPSTLEFGQVAAKPRTVAAYIELTRKFIKQASMDVEMMARNDMASVLAIAVDYAGLHGLGAANQPLGLANLSGIGSVVGGTNGLAPAWSHVVGLETEVAVDNADNGKLAYVTNAKVRGKLKQTEKSSTTGIFIWDKDGMNGYPPYVSNQVRSNLDKGTSTGVCSAIFFGNWADLVICFWGGLDVLVDPYTSSTSGSVRITAMQDADMIFRRAQSFSAMLDALTT